MATTKKRPSRHVRPASEGYDYAPLDPQLSSQVQAFARQIRQKLERTLRDIMEIGRDLISAKESLPHGQFGPWLEAEFGWTERTARNFMAVAARLHVKTEMISDLHITPTAAYLLAAPSTPDIARDEALQRAEAGEPITPAIVRELIDRVQGQLNETGEHVATPADELTKRVRKLLERYRSQCDPQQLSSLAQQLRELADGLELGPDQARDVSSRAAGGQM